MKSFDKRAFEFLLREDELSSADQCMLVRHCMSLKMYDLLAL